MHHKIDRRRKTGREEETREPQATSSLQPKSGSERRGSRDEWMQEVGSRDAHQATTAKQSNGSATDADRRREREEACDGGRKKGKRLMSDSLAHMQSPAQEESEPRLRRGYTCTREGERHSLRRRQLVQCHSLVQGSRTRESREQQVQRELMFLSVF